MEISFKGVFFFYYYYFSSGRLSAELNSLSSFGRGHYHKGVFV